MNKEKERPDNLLVWLTTSVSLETVTTAPPPDTEPEEGEEYLGTIEDEELHRLFALKNILADQTRKNRPDPLEFLFGSWEPSEELRRTHRRLEIVDRMFWGSVKEMFPLPDGFTSHIIRSGWRVYAKKSQQRQEPNTEIEVVLVQSAMPFGLRDL